MAYQSFDGEPGDSDSVAKLACLHLPEDLTGKTVLDIGCNEGFFVREALRRGAKLAVGIDMNAELIEKARARVPDGKFYPISWWELGANKFDYILFLSAIHYEAKQRALLTKLANNLNPKGTLILECGFVPDGPAEWRIVDRHDGVFRFPSQAYLESVLLSAYSTRVIGKSVSQSGDPLGRFVLHCQPSEPHVHVVYGFSMSGKTSFSQQFARKGVRVVSTDTVMTTAKQTMTKTNDPFIRYLVDNMELGQIDVFTKKMVEDGKAEEFCKFVMRFVSHDDEVTVVEGFPFLFPAVLDAFRRACLSLGFRYSATRLEGGIQSFAI